MCTAEYVVRVEHANEEWTTKRARRRNRRKGMTTGRFHENWTWEKGEKIRWTRDFCDALRKGPLWSFGNYTGDSIGRAKLLKLRTYFENNSRYSKSICTCSVITTLHIFCVRSCVQYFFLEFSFINTKRINESVWFRLISLPTAEGYCACLVSIDCVIKCQWKLYPKHRAKRGAQV